MEKKEKINRDYKQRISKIQEYAKLWRCSFELGEEDERQRSRRLERNVQITVLNWTEYKLEKDNKANLTKGDVMLIWVEECKYDTSIFFL